MFGAPLVIIQLRTSRGFKHDRIAVCGILLVLPAERHSPVHHIVVGVKSRAVLDYGKFHNAFREGTLAPTHCLREKSLLQS